MFADKFLLSVWDQSLHLYFGFPSILLALRAELGWIFWVKLHHFRLNFTLTLEIKFIKNKNQETIN